MHRHLVVVEALELRIGVSLLDVGNPRVVAPDGRLALLGPPSGKSSKGAGEEARHGVQDGAFEDVVEEGGEKHQTGADETDVDLDGPAVEYGLAHIVE